jgi:glycosyltransferase involved in cell wall biosynthesis
MMRRGTASPLISVLMPTYNCREFLGESIDCILNQTLDDLELIIVDDGSTDDSPSLLHAIASRDNRVRVVRQENVGTGVALNVAIELARGKYLARMDADDLTPPQRFAEQTAFLDAHTEITVVGGWHRTFGAVENKVHEFPTDPNHLKAALLFRNPISHPTVMMRHQAFQENGWRYSPRRQFPEDYDLWITIAERHELANIPKLYLDYRILPSAIVPNVRRHWPEEMIAIQCRLLARLGLIPNEQQRAIHYSLAFDEIRAEPEYIAQAHAWLLDILHHNQRRGVLDEQGLNRALTGRYIALVRAASRSETKIEGLANSSFRQYVTIPLPDPLTT